MTKPCFTPASETYWHDSEISLLKSVFLLGHVRGVRKFRPGCRGSSFGLCTVWPVLPSFLCRLEGTVLTPPFCFITFLSVVVFLLLHFCSVSFFCVSFLTSLCLEYFLLMSRVTCLCPSNLVFYLSLIFLSFFSFFLFHFFLSVFISFSLSHIYPSFLA